LLSQKLQSQKAKGSLTTTNRTQPLMMIRERGAAAGSRRVYYSITHYHHAQAQAQVQFSVSTLCGSSRQKQANEESFRKSICTRLALSITGSRPSTHPYWP
jgi:hypothetical protein